MVTIGISTERNEPRKSRITTTTMSAASPMVLNTSSIEARDEVRCVVDDLDRHALGQGRPGSASTAFVTSAATRQRVGGRRRGDADEGAVLAVEADLGVGALRAEFHIRHVAQAHDLIAVGADRQRRRRSPASAASSASRSRRRRNSFLVLPGAARKLVARIAANDIACGHAARGQACRIDPDPHGEVAAAEDLGVADAFERGEARLHHARQKFGHLLGIHLRAARR